MNLSFLPNFEQKHLYIYNKGGKKCVFSHTNNLCE